MPEPIEITAKDIIKRPLSTAITGVKAGESAKKGNFIQQIKEGLDQFKEIKKTLDEIGIDVGDFLPGLGGKKAPAGGLPAPVPMDARAPVAAQPTGAQQIKNFLKLLQYRYGDITVNEALEHLKQDFGQVKLSEISKLG